MVARIHAKTNYPYVVARIQAKRAKLIPPQDFEKILKMDVSEITRYIQDTTYKTEVDELGARFAGLDLLEAALTVNEERTFANIRSMLGGGGDLVEMFLARHFVEDLKTVMRGKYAGASREELLKELLLEDLDTYNVFQPLLSEEVRTPEDVARALADHGGRAREWGRVLERLPADAGLSEYEDALDKAYYARLVAELEQLGGVTGANEFLAMTRREIDARNLLNAARWVHARQKGDFSPYVIPGGRHLKVAAVIALSRAEDLDRFAEALQDNPLYLHVQEGLDKTRETGRLTAFQAAVAISTVAELRRLSHLHPLSIAPILLFLVQKDREVRVLRAVARGKAAGLSDHRLRELMSL